jgi:hypothetical protein
MRDAVNREDIVPVQEDGAVKTTTKAAKTGGHGATNMDHHGDLRSAHRAVIKIQDLILNIIHGTISMICKVQDQQAEIYTSITTTGVIADGRQLIPMARNLRESQEKVQVQVA